MPIDAHDNLIFKEFLALDSRCRDLLMEFFDWLQKEDGGSWSPETASAHAHAADRYLRDFVVEIMESAPEASDLKMVRRYLANWYIINTLEPSFEEVDLIAQALSLLHRFMSTAGVIDKANADGVEKVLADTAIFHERLESFWELTAESIPAWRAVDDYRAGIGQSGSIQ